MAVDLERMLEKALEALGREVNNLFTATSSRKLSPTEARDLAAYVKLLKDINAEASKRAANMSLEELREALNADTGKMAGSE